MNMIETLLAAGGGGVVKQLAGQFGITPQQATSASSALLPALAGGLKERLASGDSSGISSLITGGGLSKFADDPSSLATPAAVDQGNSLLNRIFGSGDLSNIASLAGEKAGISSGIVNSMLPVAAALFGGFLSKRAAAGDNLTDVVGQLTSVGHGGIIDAVKGFAAKMFG